MKLKDLLQRRIVFYTAALVIAAITMLFAAYIRSPAEGSFPIDGQWHLSYQGKRIGTFELPVYKTGNSSLQFNTGVYSFTSDFFIPRTLSVPLLVLPEINANAFSVYIDGVSIGRIGDMQNGRTNRWNTPHTFILPEALESGTHTIELKGYGLYEIGIAAAPYLYNGNSYSVKILLLYFSLSLFLLV